MRTTAVSQDFLQNCTSAAVMRYVMCGVLLPLLPSWCCAMTLMIQNKAPAEVVSSDRQSPMLRQGDQAINDVVVFPVGLWDSQKEVGGIKFRAIDHHPSSLSHHGTWVIDTVTPPLVFPESVHSRRITSDIYYKVTVTKTEAKYLSNETNSHVIHIEMWFYPATRHLCCSVVWSGNEGCCDVRWLGRRLRWWRCVEEGKQEVRMWWKRTSQ